MRQVNVCGRTVARACAAAAAATLGLTLAGCTGASPHAASTSAQTRQFLPVTPHQVGTVARGCPARPQRAIPGCAVPAAMVPKLTAVAENLARAEGGHRLDWASAVVTTHAKALTSATPGDTEPQGQQTVVYLLTLKGDFTDDGASIPPGAHAPTGTWASLVLTARPPAETDYGLSKHPPAVPPSRLGPVTYLHVH